MPMRTHYIKILSQNRILKIDSNLNLLEALMRHGIFLRADCGGQGSCGKCRVELLSEDGRPESVLACQTRVVQDLTIRIPESAISSSFIMDKAQVDLPDSFYRRFQPLGADRLGAAVDLGTTTVAVYLCDLLRGEVLSSIALKNPQALYGADVMSRITAVVHDVNTLNNMQALTVKGIQWGIDTLISKAAIPGAAVARMVAVGNPTMIHILAGVDPSPLGTAPYQPVFSRPRTFDAKSLGFDSTFPIQTLPNMSGFLGGDILAAAQAADMIAQPDGTLLIDLGTNGELVLKQNDQLFHATSCATGPAFEGATLSCGIQAIPGAINGIELGPGRTLAGFSMVNPENRPGLKPTGICGAGVISSVAQFCRSGVIRPDGAFSSGQDRFTLVPEDSAQPALYLSQKDIRSVQLGKSALITGIQFLLKRAGFDRPKKLIIAGAFGAYLPKPDLIRLGMIPDLEDDRIKIAGNLAGSGAVMAVCDPRSIQDATDMAAKIQTVELALDTQFQASFVENLGFPA